MLVSHCIFNQWNLTFKILVRIQVYWRKKLNVVKQKLHISKYLSSYLIFVQRYQYFYSLFFFCCLYMLHSTCSQALKNLQMLEPESDSKNF